MAPPTPADLGSDPNQPSAPQRPRVQVHVQVPTAPPASDVQNDKASSPTTNPTSPSAAATGSAKKKKPRSASRSIYLPNSKYPSLRVWVTVSAVALAVLFTCIQWLVMRGPGETHIGSDLPAARAAWRIGRMQVHVSQVLSLAVGATTSHLQAWATGDVASMSQATADLAMRAPAVLVGGSGILSSFSVTAGTTTLAGLTTLSDGHGYAISIRGSVRTDTQIDFSTGATIGTSVTTTATLAATAWYQNLQNLLASSTASPLAVPIIAPPGASSANAVLSPPILAWDTRVTLSSQDWLAFAIRTRLTRPPTDATAAQSLTVHASIPYSLLANALASALRGNSQIPAAAAYIIDAGSLEVVVAMTTASPASTNIVPNYAPLRVPLSQLTIAGTSSDLVLTAIASAIIASAAQRDMLTNGRSWLVTTSSSSSTTTGTMPAGTYQVTVGSLVSSSSSSQLPGGAVMFSAGAVGDLPANWRIVYAEPTAATETIKAGLRNSLLVLFVIMWGVVAVVAATTVAPISQALDRMSLAVISLSRGVNPDVDVVARASSMGRRLPEVVHDVAGALAVMVAQHGFRSWFAGFSRRRAAMTGGKA
ncbi:hypothetical protein BC828DRAFT_436823 [Blastocladiella britannica]|nr:hypothetical protein BC828DRAFT_436823 [Blastocladiella britannica]